MSAYGNGPLQASIPPFEWPELPTFWAAWDELDLPRPVEGADGDAIGVFWTASATDPRTETRSSARTAYYEPAKNRSNYHLVTYSYVNEILFDGLTATGVNIVSRADNSSYTAYACKEIIMAAGAVHTPALLQLSGIGPSDVLTEAGIDVKLDFPAVGSNFQDHPTAYLNWNSKLAHTCFLVVVD